MTKTDFYLYMTIVGVFITICQIIIQVKSFQSSKAEKKRYCFINVVLTFFVVFGSFWFINQYKVVSEDENLTMGDMLIKAEEYYKTNDYLNAINIYNSETMNTNAIALSNLGYFYEHGVGVNKDIQRAKENYQKAKQLGNEKALDNWIICILNYPKSYGEVLECLKEGYDNNSQTTFEFIGKSMFLEKIDISDRKKADENVKSFFECSEDRQMEILEGTQYENYVRQEDFSGIESEFCTYKSRTEILKEVVDVVPYEIITDSGERKSAMEPVYMERKITYLDVIEKRFYFANDYQTKFIEYIK